jgi:hypothetical protein
MKELEQRVTELEQRLDSGENVEATADIIEFVQSLDLSNHQERALAIAYYLEKYRDYDNFTSGDIEEGYRECRLTRPANMSDVLGKMNDNYGWSIRDGKDGQVALWRLSIDGQQKIEEELENV